MLQAVAKAGATVLERTPFAIDDAQYSSENEDEEGKDEEEDEDEEEEEEEEDEEEEDEEEEEEEEEEDEDEDEDEDEVNEDDQVLDEVDAFLEAHDSGLTEADREVAKRTFLFLLLVAEAYFPFLLQNFKQRNRSSNRENLMKETAGIL